MRDRWHGRGRRGWLMVALVLLGVSAVAPAARADGTPAVAPAVGPWPGVAVTDAQGWTLRDVTLRLAVDGSGLVVVRADGAERTLSFADVTVVRAADGRDLTDEVLALAPAGSVRAPAAAAPGVGGDPEFAIPAAEGSRARPRAGGREAPVFSAAFDVGAGAAAVMGDWFWGADNGGFVQAGARVGTSGRQYVHMVFRSQSLGSAHYFTYDDPPIEVRFTMRSYQVLLGLLEERQGRHGVRARAYVEGGGGLMQIVTDGGARDGSVTRFGLAVQTGAWVRAGEHVAVDIGFHGFYKPGWLDDEAGGASCGVHAGLVLVR